MIYCPLLCSVDTVMYCLPATSHFKILICEYKLIGTFLLKHSPHNSVALSETLEVLSLSRQVMQNTHMAASALFFFPESTLEHLVTPAGMSRCLAHAEVLAERPALGLAVSGASDPKSSHGGRCSSAPVPAMAHVALLFGVGGSILTEEKALWPNEL